MRVEPTRLHVPFAGQTMGCWTIAMAIAAPLIFALVLTADLSESSSRGAAFFAMLQAFAIGGIPVGALLLGGYFVYELAISGWRWADRIALTLTDELLLCHATIYRRPIAIANLESVTVTHRGSGWIKTINPSLIIRWREDGDRSTRQRMVRNVDLTSPQAQAFAEALRSAQKWIGDD